MLDVDGDENEAVGPNSPASRLWRGDRLAVDPDGGALHVCYGDGEVFDTIPLPPGRHTTNAHLAVMPKGMWLVAGLGVTVLRRNPYVPIAPVGEFESAANPRFRVTNAMRQAREMERRLNLLEAQASRERRADRAQERADASPIIEDAEADAGNGGEGESAEAETEAKAE